MSDTAKAAYEAWYRKRGKDPGKDVPTWTQLATDHQEAWKAAVQAVIRVLWLGDDGEGNGEADENRCGKAK